MIEKLLDSQQAEVVFAVAVALIVATPEAQLEVEKTKGGFALWSMSRSSLKYAYKLKTLF